MDANPDQIRRAMEAIDQAPRTESGLIIPPHVAAEQAAAVPEMPPLNRRARRHIAKKQRRRGKR